MNSLSHSEHDLFCHQSSERRSFFSPFSPSISTCITFKWLNLESIIIFRSLPFCHYSCFVFPLILMYLLVSWSHTNILSISIKKSNFFHHSFEMIIFTISWTVSISYIAFCFIDLPHRRPIIQWLMATIFSLLSQNQSSTNYPNRWEQFNNFSVTTTNNELSIADSRARRTRKQSKPWQIKFQSKTWFFEAIQMKRGELNFIFFI